MKRLGFKLWAGMMAMVMIVLLLLWFFQVVFLESLYTKMRIAEIKREAAAISKLLAQGKDGEFHDKADAFAYTNNLSIEVLDRAGITLYVGGSTGSGGQMPMMRNGSRVEAYQKTFAGEEIAIPLTHPRFGNKFMLIGLPVRLTGNETGALIMNLPLAPVEDTAAIIKKQLLLITFILLAAALILSYILSRSFTSPILEMKKIAERMASGDFSKRIKSRRQDEIGQLASTINMMGQELSGIEQLRKDLIANVSHELRTPLSLIRGYAETIRDVTGHVPDKREKQLAIIIEESERLSKIVDDILHLSQIQAGYYNFKFEPFFIHTTIRNVLKRYEMLSAETGINISVRHTGDLMVLADEPRMEQVLFNLINNAFNHTPHGGAITIQVKEAPGTVRVEVSDTGDGIPQEDLPQVWDRYYRADKAGGRKNAGTGLGLAIVKSVLEAHQALYGVESVIGEGTTFWFELSKQNNGPFE